MLRRIVVGEVSSFAGWTPAARAVIERACATYGGEERWRHLRLALEMRSLSGLLPWMKGVGRTFPMPTRVLVTPAAGSAIFEDYPAPGERGHFDGGTLWLEQPGRPHVRTALHRGTFAGWRKWRRWQPLDALYFLGYAITHYHAVPFTLGEARLVDHQVRRGIDAVTVDFPATLHTHSRRQTFHLDGDGLIRRHDYVAHIVGWWAQGAHFWRDYSEVDGFPVALTRHVTARLGGLAVPVTALHAELALVS
jgi:hypothetical protein